MLNPVYRVTLISLLILLGSSLSLGRSGVPQSWQKIDAGGAFTFLLLQGMKKTDMAGVESFLGEYLDAERRFLFVHEPYSYLSYDSRRSDEMKGYQETEASISGRKAVIRTYHTEENGRRTYVAEAHIGDWARSRVELFMSLEGKSPADLEIAEQIFCSIKFPEHKGTPNNGMHPTADTTALMQSESFGAAGDWRR